MVRTTIGRVILNEAFLDDFEFRNHSVLKSDIARSTTTVHRYDRATVEETLDNLKNLGFHYATRAGVTIGVEDVTVPPAKQTILDEHEKKAQKVEGQYRKGIITDDERRQELIEIWTQATDEVKNAMEEGFTPTNPIFMMANSRRPRNIMQIRQLAGMRGLVANPKGEIIPRPIKSNFREGLSVLEYFISRTRRPQGTGRHRAAHGRLRVPHPASVDVAQELIVREEDCGTDRSIPIHVNVRRPDGSVAKGQHADTSLFGRVLSEDVKVDGKKIASAGDELDDEVTAAVLESGIDEVQVRSVTTCEAEIGVCAACYGRSLASGRMVDIGEAVGIIAAQSIGEPGTQLTMRTFHTGGVAGEDITHGLPRVVELFEARKPKGEAQITEISGTVSIEDDEEKHQRHILVTDESGDQVEYPVSYRARLTVSAGDAVVVGQQLTEGSVNPHEKLRVEGVLALQNHLVDEVQQVYRSQGVTIHDKHIELIARQMLRKVHIIEPGDTEFLPGDMIARRAFEEKNAEVVEAGGVPASARPVLLGITKASLATDSWLSAASFQETTRVLTDAAISAKSDPLLGLKENVIIGKLIPAGSGLARYRNVAVQIKPEAIPSTGWRVSARSRRPWRARPASRRSWGSRASRPSRCSAAGCRRSRPTRSRTGAGPARGRGPLGSVTAGAGPVGPAPLRAGGDLRGGGSRSRRLPTTRSPVRLVPPGAPRHRFTEGPAFREAGEGCTVTRRRLLVFVVASTVVAGSLAAVPTGAAPRTGEAPLFEGVTTVALQHLGATQPLAELSGLAPATARTQRETPSAALERLRPRIGARTGRDHRTADPRPAVRARRGCRLGAEADLIRSWEEQLLRSGLVQCRERVLPGAARPGALRWPRPRRRDDQQHRADLHAERARAAAGNLRHPGNRAGGDLAQRVVRLPAGDRHRDGEFGPFTTDPSCYYDRRLKRWFHVELTIQQDPVTGDFTGENSIDIAVSRSADPTGSWDSTGSRAERRQRRHARSRV